MLFLSDNLRDRRAYIVQVACEIQSMKRVTYIV